MLLSLSAIGPREGRIRAKVLRPRRRFACWAIGLTGVVGLSGRRAKTGFS
jgi:hypothetical protein